MPKKALIILADGFEETEAITPIDILRRAGVEVTVAGLHARQVTGSHQVTIFADTTLKELKDNFDVTILPGGSPGAANLAASQKVLNLVQEMSRQKKMVAAICAAPALVLAPTGILKNKSATCFPGLQQKFSAETRFREDPVVVDGNIITSRGVGTALKFSLAIVEKLCGQEVSEKVGQAVLA
jgi:protein deglycase